MRATALLLFGLALLPHEVQADQTRARLKAIITRRPNRGRNGG